MAGMVLGTKSSFKALGPMENVMDLGQSKEPNPPELMSDLGYSFLKQAYSPPRPPILKPAELT